jgi:hypothetical protein
MRMLDLAPSIGQLHSAKYRCEQCGTETEREFKVDAKG